MKSSNKLSAIGVFFAALLMASVTAVFAINSANGGLQPVLKIELTGSVQRSGKAIAVADAGLVNSGEVIDWTIDSKNVGKANALSHDAVAQIPAGTSFVSGSEKSDAGAKVSFSIDNGKSFSEKPVLQVKMQDGSFKEVAAPVSSYTQIKYTWNSTLAPADSRKATYQVSVK